MSSTHFIPSFAMHMTGATSRSVTKREPSDPTFHLPDLVVNSRLGADAASIVGWPMAPSPSHPLALQVSSSSSSPSPSETGTVASYPLKRANWTRRLVITKQPASEFYKDEGGKANALEVEVTLVEFNEHGEPARSPDDDFIAIPLRILLFFESGKRVDDTDQEIFRFVGNDYDSVVIRASTRKALVQFRLEKVSRRKDGQRFKLRIEVDQEQCTANVADLTPVFTNAICVLSKRKHPSYSSDSSARMKEPPPKLLKRDLSHLEEKLSAKIDGLTAHIHHLSQQIQKQNELIAKHMMPVSPMPLMHCGPNESATVLEWLLRPGPTDDGLWPKPATESHLGPATSMPYFEVPEEPFHDVGANLPEAPAPATTTASPPSDVRLEATPPSLSLSDI